MSLIGFYRAAAQNLTFTTNSFDVVGSPTCVIATDVNGDGKLDLVSANYLPSGPCTLTVITNNGSGGFGSNATLYVGSFPVSVIATDISGSGKVDLICASQSPSNNTLTVLTNDGRGGFGTNAMLTIGGGPRAVVAVDVNGDGKVDLICANPGSNTLSVLTNNGSGVFGSNATLNVGDGPISIVAADINGDGKLDLICANATGLGGPGPGTLTVFTNNGSGIFGFSATLIVGSHPVSVVVADISGNGIPDLISANNRDNTLTVLTNNGSGVFGSNATLNVGKGPLSVVAADINGDGKLDLIFANSSTNTLEVLTNSGSGGFGSNATLNVGNQPNWVIAADVNGDGKLDLISANNSTISVLINTSPFPSPISMPPLSINFHRNATRVSWPSASPGWSLQQNQDLTTAYWSPSGYSGYDISDDGTNKSLTMPLIPGNLFFRLLHP